MAAKRTRAADEMAAAPARTHTAARQSRGHHHRQNTESTINMTIQTTTTATDLPTEGTPSAAIRIYLKPTRLNDHGQLYQVRLHNCRTGRIIAHGSISPSPSKEPPWRVGQIRVAGRVSFPLPLTRAGDWRRAPGLTGLIGPLKPTPGGLAWGSYLGLSGYQVVLTSGVRTP